MNTNFKVIGLTRLGIKPESTAQETDAPYHSAREAVNTKCKVIGLTRPVIKPESTALVAHALIAGPFDRVADHQ